MTDGEHRPVRSFVRREGRVTRAQERALDELLPRFGTADAPAVLDLDALFGRSAPRVLEIGFGDGEALAAVAKADPDTDHLGVEVHRPGVGHLLLALEREALSNVRVIVDDAVEVLSQLPEASFVRINIWFPDPWPKARHHKRRIVQQAFAELAASRLQPGGLLHLATDWAPYAEHMQAVLAEVSAFEPAGDPGDYRPPTKYERRGERLGHEVSDLLFRRV